MNESKHTRTLFFKIPCAPADHAPTGLRKCSDSQVFRANQLHLLALEADDNQQWTSNVDSEIVSER